MSGILENPHSNEGKVEKEFQSHLKEMILRRLQKSQTGEEQENGEEEEDFVRDLSQRLSRYFPEYTEGFAEISGMLGQGPLVGEKNLIAEQLARSTSKLLLSRLSPRQVDDRFRDVIIKERGWYFVNELCAYEIEGDDVILHVPPTFSRSILETAALFQAGLREFAAQLQTNEDLKKVHSVTGTSWIAFKHKKALQNVGWTIVFEDADAEEATAQMSREKFIETYGETKNKLE